MLWDQLLPYELPRPLWSSSEAPLGVLFLSEIRQVAIQGGTSWPWNSLPRGVYLSPTVATSCWWEETLLLYLAKINPPQKINPLPKK